MATHQPAAVRPPDAAYVRQRWIPRKTVDWVEECDAILSSHGVAVGQKRYATRDSARHHARRLKRLLVELRMREEWELREHMEQVDGGWIWSVEYLGRNDG